MDYIASFEPSAAEPLEDDAVPVIVPEESCPGAPAYDTMSPQVDIEELLLSSQLLLNSVQKTLDGETDTLEISKPSTEVDVLSSRSRCIPEACVRQWAKELIVAVDALHAKNITLGHLSAHNLLLGKNGQLLITYYHFQDFSDAISKHSCTENSFLAPERLTSRSSDWYSVGVVLYELLTGHPFQDHHPGRWCYFELQFPDTVRLTSAATSLLDGVSRLDIIVSLTTFVDTILPYSSFSCSLRIQRPGWDSRTSVHMHFLMRLTHHHPITDITNDRFEIKDYTYITILPAYYCIYQVYPRIYPLIKG